ncbi:MAG: hypothetical protein GTO45_30800 [Candidatus Aminicenantes bacterium]|nr:hypothetical protein [Candidatus Aminicenantes bacterium]NIM83181.1 hypothetical protein [Candidatus Aminicenantes bacterium]NIN22558.1 hypothetical protein [Candidatus Aminicenantes bacterium]NIN46327.1 hypothetical protein [Candidatus Aminicenantes bacterium]NIN89167.1 hypothetical protein [Candidatus Aminicenantes bacterium]
MKRILVLLVLLLFLAMIFRGFPGNISAQEAKDDVQDEEVTELPPDMIIKDIQVGWNNRSVMTRKAKGINDVEIPAREGIITIHIYHSQQYSGNDLVYEFKLEGFDLEWTQDDAGMKQVRYVYLKPGNYVFKIKRSHIKVGKAKNTVEETVRLKIIPPIWATWWFRLSVLVVVVGAIAGYVKIKISRVKKYREQELILSRMQSQLAEAELKALKAQLHPHFLFNTFNVISSLMHENVEAADEVLTKLGDLLRLMFSNAGQQMVTLKSEIEFISIYLELHQVRFQDKLNVVMEIADDTLAAQIPNFLLQPLVENAVIHGTSKEKPENKIFIGSQHKNGRLVLIIRDNGPGIPLLDTGDLMNIKKGFGLKSTLERLKIGYESDYNFRLENSPEGGLIVLIDIPYNSNQGEK